MMFTVTIIYLNILEERISLTTLRILHKDIHRLIHRKDTETIASEIQKFDLT